MGRQRWMERRREVGREGWKRREGGKDGREKRGREG